MAKLPLKWVLSLTVFLTLGCGNSETPTSLNPITKFSLPTSTSESPYGFLFNMEDTFVFGCLDTSQNRQQVVKCLNAASYFYKEKSDETLREILPLVTSAELELLNDVLANMAAQDVRELELSKKLSERRANPEWDVNLAHCVMHGNRSKYLYLRALHHSLKVNG